MFVVDYQVKWNMTKLIIDWMCAWEAKCMPKSFSSPLPCVCHRAYWRKLTWWGMTDLELLLQQVTNFHWLVLSKYKSVNAATMLNYSLLNKIYVVVLVPSHGNCAYQEGTALPLMPCLCRSFSAQLSSSSAWGAIDKHPRLCNTPLTAPDWAHFLTYLGWGLKFSPQSSAEGEKTYIWACSTPNVQLKKYEWAQAGRLSINRVLWRPVWTCGNRQGIVLPGLSVSGL